MDLAYLIAIGPRRFHWAAWWAVRSLRACGRFAGEIAVFSNRPYRFAEGATTIVVRDQEVLAKPNWMKMRAREHVDLGSYERVLFLDSDIAVALPLDPFLAAASRTRTLVGTDDLGHTIGGGFSWRCLEPQEIEANRQRRAINAGFYVMPGDLAAAWLATWEKLQRETLGRPGPGWCQPGLNACMVRGLIPVTLIERVMWFPKRDPRKTHCDPDPALVHFHGIGRHLNRYWRMRAFVRQALRRRH